ncbi:hypothetical protein F2Q70_00013547 [Brassica cretica]|uniref:LisH domain-containing protein n=1 Tax=Brassica cretica TaxID=69181 RepID=A0A8S9M1J8_BRACR|nr:hypothetical protein F2Q70_00013547 [Brassica cretica]
MSQTNWEADKIYLLLCCCNSFDYRKVLLLDFVWLGGRFVWLDVYIYDYLVKRDLKATAQAFQAEGKVSSDPVAIDAPGGFLFEWWSVFWDIFIARTNEKHSEVAASYIEVSFYICAKLQYSLYDPVMRQNSGSGSALANNNKAYEERVKMPTQRDSVDETAMKRFGDNVGQLLDPNHASMLKSAGASGQPAGQVLHGASGGISPQVQARNQQLSGSAMDIKSEINPVLTPRTPVPEGSLIGIPGSNQGNNLTLKGWPLTADMDRFVEDGSLDDNVESFLSNEDGDQRDAIGRCMDVSKGFTFTEVNSVRASTSKVTCCHFSSDGKMLASAGHDKKAVLWHTDTMKPKTTLEEHTAMITDVRFSPSLPRLATSSFDKTVRVWDADNKGYSIRTFMGHSSMVTSLDFHPNKDDLICSCDTDGEIRYWSINNGSYTRVYKGGSTQLRFQPRVGKYLAASSANVVSVLDVETQACRHSLQGHANQINSVCWDPSGDFLASVSEDMVKVWTLGTGSEGECVHELSCNGNKFQSCVFHPTYPSLLVIGCYQSLELWNMSENKTMTLPAHEGLIASLAVSTATGLVASASHDKLVKLWK